MRILVGQNHLDTIGGSETYTFALVEELRRRDIEVDVVCVRRGLVSELMQDRLKVSINRLQKKYDCCFISHNSVVKIVLENNIKSENLFQICHGTIPDLEQPYKDEKVRFISISKEVHDHLLHKQIESEIIYNGVNLERFKKTEISKNLSNIFSLSQSTRFNTMLSKICKKYGFNFSYRNKFEKPIFSVEQEIYNSDLIISLGRGAYESLSCGKNVIIADWRPYQEPLMDGFITNENINKFIEKNCSGRTERRQITEDSIVSELKKYNLQQGNENRKFAEENLDIKKKVDQMLSLIR